MDAKVTVQSTLFQDDHKLDSSLPSKKEKIDQLADLTRQVQEHNQFVNRLRTQYRLTVATLTEQIQLCEERLKLKMAELRIYVNSNYGRGKELENLRLTTPQLREDWVITEAKRLGYDLDDRWCKEMKLCLDLINKGEGDNDFIPKKYRLPYNLINERAKLKVMSDQMHLLTIELKHL